MPDIIIPPQPAPPPPQGATAEQLRDYYAAVAVYNHAINGPAQAAACAAGAAATQAQAEANATLAAAIEYAADKDAEPRIIHHENARTPPTRADLVMRLVESMPQVTGLTDLGVVDLADKQVDALLKRYPDLLG